MYATRPSQTWRGKAFPSSTRGPWIASYPAGICGELGIRLQGKRIYELADGSEITFDVGVGQVEFMGEVVGATVIFGADDAEPILGVTVLESVGIKVDPRSQQLGCLPAARLTAVGGSRD